MDPRTPLPHLPAVLPLLLWLVAIGGGCRSTPQLMPTPNCYLNQDSTFRNVPPPFQTNLVDLLYITDRLPETNRGRLHYGHGRANSIAFGSCRVDLGRDVPWDRLVRESTRSHREGSFPIQIRDLREIGRFPDTPYPLIVEDDRLVLDREVLELDARARQALTSEIERRLALTPKKHVFLYVHGYNNRFEWVGLLAAQMWHFLQREGVPLLYSWPAGKGGMFGYAYDRESGEFTVHHLKQVLRLLMQCQAIEGLHLVAHSRGADILTTALRELAAESRDPGEWIGHLPKVSNLVLVAPDIDLQVAAQRVHSEHLHLAVKRMTIYVCSKDKAIRFANWLFEGARRLGGVRSDDFTPDQLAQMRQYGNVHIIDARVSSSFLNHGYFYNDPAVSSDLLQLLRADADPGRENGRPLDTDDGVIWRLTPGYGRVDP